MEILKYTKIYPLTDWPKALPYIFILVVMDVILCWPQCLSPHTFLCGFQEALESAMNSGLWGHALFLASKMDSRSYTTVLNR